MQITKLRKLLIRLWDHIKGKYRKKLAVLLGAMIMATLAEAVTIGAVLPFLGVLTEPERVFENKMLNPIVKSFGITEPHELLFPITVIFIAAALVSGGMRIVLLSFQTRLAFAIGTEISSEVYIRTLYQNFLVHVSRNSSEVITGISTKTHMVIFGILLPILYIGSSLFLLVVILIVILWIQPLVAMISFGGFGSVYLIIMKLTKNKLSRDSSLMNSESSQVTKALQEGLGAIRDILIDGTQKIYCDIYSRADKSLRKTQADIQIIGAAPRYIVEPLGIGIIAALAYFLSISVNGINSAIPVLGALAIGAQKMLPCLQLIYNSMTSIRGAQASLEDVLDLLDQPMPQSSQGQNSRELPFESSLKFCDVSYRYGDGSASVLKGIDFEISKGSKVGFIGKSGCGKSTILDLLMGLLTPTDGKIFVDERPLDEKNIRSWQEKISHVPQSIFLTDNTIAENIAFGIMPSEVDYDRVYMAAKQAQLDKSIESWPQAYETIVGEKGVRLSGGQLQRIGLARAFYKMSEVIILDEATSALDAETECAVMESVDNLGCGTTLLIVAHRLTTLKNCDLIFEISDGRIKKCGTYEEMLLRN